MTNQYRFSVALGVAGVMSLLPLRADEKKDETKGKRVVVESDGLKSAAPADWKQEEVTAKFRTHHFRIPHVADDKTDAEMIIFFFGAGGGGSADANVKRWKGFFIPPEGKQIDDVAKVDNFKVGNGSVTYLHVQATYKFKERPFSPA